MIIIIGILFTGLVATLMGIFLTGGGAWSKYKEWEREHAYDPPVHESISSNFPDPAILYHEKVFYAFATNNAAGVLFRPENASELGYGAANIQLAVSYNHFGSWTLREPAQQPLARVGQWADLGMTKSTIEAPAIPKAQG